MHLELFTRTSGKSELQQALDRDRAKRETGTVDELSPAPEAQTPEGGKPLFKRPRKPENMFRLDLLNGWMKP
jgi:hypothetical protein